ncbi:MAG: Mrp/NBP35 family ATP-binding protein [Salibacteraceae bacterium]|jgi:ATP-binding protein involved in chromosome partitioning|nr:Mrp/NBP35 family ATP-binding protein [Salibacteraceae bacterium]MDP4686966.1 Mrp/NBP35 family ATP-binding protein [Salibacteraceae bacterium]MDP4764064.1 Mrp/NBP35 family ATP-binding protein [Salibacteraceae bacterium]MDP4845341.1 Mrp/NBP35 family ATP-binding protein [Salibacteraceae bacterium]MDP4934487.1 Mrp/NBP35 family ATP-binding protein [Salibacteraceae bacterium]
MSVTREQVLDALSHVIEPELKKDVVALGLVSNIKIEGNTVSFEVKASNPAMHYRKRIEEACIHQLRRFLGDDVAILPNVTSLPSNVDRDPGQRKILPQVKKIIAVASGKGGVGKSTITANLAAGLAKRGYKVGLVDADIYGPSMPLMFDVVNEKPSVSGEGEDNKMMPVESYGVKMLSIGFFAEANQAIVWRGPMASKALTQMFTDVHWGELDYMFIDLPPGTGDIHLSLVAQIPLDGVVIVSTPQDVALADARKGIGMFKLDSINVKVLGLVENMSWFTPAELPENKYYIFGKDGAKQLAEELNVSLLGQIPLVQSIREAGDVGRPAVLQTDTPQSIALNEMIDNLLKTL